MENLIELKNNYNSLDKLCSYLKTASTFECSKEYDQWEVRTDVNGQMAQCIVLKKSNMHAVKVFFVNENTVKVNHIIPNKIMNAYFGKSQKNYQNILEIITGKIKGIVLAPTQEKAFEEMEQVLHKISA
ncbi:MAG: hypothetical protein V3V28_02630 [Polaribacter sp.]|uniref:hypothetical protein n=1 Tax=Polaribacter sp. TaxID=1920175 RepID=UPI002F35343F